MLYFVAICFIAKVFDSFSFNYFFLTMQNP